MHGPGAPPPDLRSPPAGGFGDPQGPAPPTWGLQHRPEMQRDAERGAKLVRLSTTLLLGGLFAMLGGAGCGILVGVAAFGAGAVVGIGFVIASAIVGQIGRGLQGRVI